VTRRRRCGRRLSEACASGSGHVPVPVRGGPQLIPRPSVVTPGPDPWWEADPPKVVPLEAVRRAFGQPQAGSGGRQVVDGAMAGAEAAAGERERSGAALGPDVVGEWGASGRRSRRHGRRGARDNPPIPATPPVSPEVADSVLDERLPMVDPRPAAVLCALFEEDGDSWVVLTRRSTRLRSHTGEVSFPGGRLDQGETAVSAALREADEEVGIPPSTVEIIGRLSPLATMTSRSAIVPFVGVLRQRPVLHPNPAEVDRAFSVPLSELMAPGVYHEERWGFPGGGDRAIHFFELPGDTVWGATAKMLRELLDRTYPDPA
jgi:8-oxo-dGTP pyrophosphatase MutT (NUDIX family)